MAPNQGTSPPPPKHTTHTTHTPHVPLLPHTMKTLSSLFVLALLFSLDPAASFSPSGNSPRVCTSCFATSDRRDFLSAAVTAAAGVGVFTVPTSSLADVSDGNSLPQGAAQFSRVIKVRAQLKVRILTQKALLRARIVLSLFAKFATDRSMGFRVAFTCFIAPLISATCTTTHFTLP
jgi:hypothetical protein